MSVLEVVDALGPEHREVITTGGYIIAALIAAVSGILVALIQSGRKAAKRAASQTETNGDDHTAVAELLAAQSDVLDQVQAELIRQRNTNEAHARQSEARHRESRQDSLNIRDEMRLEREERVALATYVVENLPKKETP